MVIATLFSKISKKKIAGDRRKSRKDDAPPEPGPPSRPPLPHRLVSEGSPSSTPPGPPPQRPLPPPPGQFDPRAAGAKPSTPPSRDQQNRNSRIIQVIILDTYL